jgi:hypothetical protein
MSLETIAEEVKNVVNEAAASVETKVEGVVKEIKAETVKVDDRVKVEISDAEKFFMSRTENDFLKAQLEITQLSQRITHLQEVTKKASAAYTAKAEEMAKTYGVELKDFIYNAVENAFTKK